MSGADSAVVTRGARAMQAVAVVALLAWSVGAVLDVGGHSDVLLGLYGFVLTFAFGKAYALVPSYFDRALAVPTAPTVHAVLAAVGVAGLATADLGGPALLEPVGAVAWALGVATFVVTIGATVRDNPTGAETGTGDHAADRRPVDRLANAAVPVVVAYLAVGAALTVAAAVDLSVPLVVGTAGTSHLLAAGGAALLVFAVGFRLLPRLLVVSVPRAAVAVVLGAGAVGPALLSLFLYDPPWFAVAAVVEAVAVVGFAATYLVLFARSERRRVGFYAVGLAAVAGVAGVSLGLHVAVAGFEPGLVPAHRRLNLLGFLGLTVVGVALTLYPPTAGRFPGATDRTGWTAVAGIAAGLAVEVLGHLALGANAVLLGRLLALAGVAAFAWLLLGLFVQRSALLGR